MISDVGGRGGLDTRPYPKNDIETEECGDSRCRLQAPQGRALASSARGGGGRLRFRGESEYSGSTRPASAPGSPHRRNRPGLTFPRSNRRLRSPPPRPGSPRSGGVPTAAWSLAGRGPRDPSGPGSSPFLRHYRLLRFRSRVESEEQNHKTETNSRRRDVRGSPDGGAWGGA